jgi:hypothetical protein
MVSVLVSVADALPTKPLLHKQLGLEARVGIEPTMRLLQSPALPLGYPALGSEKCIFFQAAAQVQLRSIFGAPALAPELFSEQAFAGQIIRLGSNPRN